MARILKFFSSTLQNFKIKYFHKDAQKYGYLTVGDTVRIFVFKQLNSPLHTLVCRKLEYKMHKLY